MDVGGATHWAPGRVVSKREILERFATDYGGVEPIVEESSAPADRYRLPDGTTFGIIASTTEPFCKSCDRSRLTADGMWYLCLYASRGIDLRSAIRGGASAQQLASTISQARGRRETIEGQKFAWRLGRSSRVRSDQLRSARIPTSRCIRGGDRQERCGRSEQLTGVTRRARQLTVAVAGRRRRSGRTPRSVPRQSALRSDSRCCAAPACRRACRP